MRILTSLMAGGLFAATTAISSVSAFAMTASQSVEVETVVQNPDGTETLVRAPADTVSPGSRVVYTVAYTNTDAEARSDLVFTMPVPDELTYIEGSAELPGTAVTVSTDGGESFGPRGAAMVERDGTVERAGAEDITHIRWNIAGPVASGASDKVAFKAVLN